MSIRVEDLKILQIILQHKSLTPASELLNVSQPAITARLNKLRDCFNDQLIYRHGNKMIPTEKGTNLLQQLKILDDHIDEIIPKSIFNPYKDISEITLYINEAYAIQDKLISRIIDEIQSYNSSHKINIEITPLKWAPKVSYKESLNFDLAIGIHNLKDGYGYEILGTQDLAIVYDRYPVKEIEASYDSFINLPHITIDQGKEDNFFLKYFNNKDPRNIKVRLDNLHAIKSTLSDKYVTVLTKDIASYLNLKSIPLPIATEEINVYMLYDSRLKRNPKNVWIRNLVKSILPINGNK